MLYYSAASPVGMFQPTIQSCAMTLVPSRPDARHGYVKVYFLVICTGNVCCSSANLRYFVCLPFPCPVLPAGRKTYQFLVIYDELVTNFILALVAVAILSMLVLGQIAISLIVCFTVVSVFSAVLPRWVNLSFMTSLAMSCEVHSR